MTGTHWLEEAGLIQGPITITNTHSCGVARDATIRWCSQQMADFPPWALPVAAEICLMAQLMHPCRNTKIASPSGPSWSYPDFKGKPTQQKGGSDMLDLIVKSAKLVQDFGSTQPTGEISNQGY
jgi:hypothetical protein